MAKITLTGQDLSIDKIEQLVDDTKLQIELSPKAIAAAKRSQKFLQENLKGNIIYGINTGFGPMASHVLASDQLVVLQENLIRSHATGMGDPIDEKFVLAAMVVRLNTLLKGYSGVSEDLLRQLEFFINRRIIPVVYEHGAVGTSGDLVQLAHIALALIGEGEVSYEGRRSKASEVLNKLKRKPHQLQPKEGLSLINGTAMMTGISSIVIRQSERLLNLAVLNGSLALELVRGYEDSISEKLHELRPHKGQQEVARQIRTILAQSKLLRPRAHLKHNYKDLEIKDQVEKIADDVQDVYSFRCIPQILGPVFDTLANSKRIIETEMNSVTDNPIINPPQKEFLHGGNFHGDYVAAAIDQLKMTIVKLTMLAERRANFFLNQKVNMRFPPFLNLNKPGLTLAMQGMQFVATSTTAQSQTLAYPHYVHSISTNADNQDVVSMGTDAALIAHKVTENAYIVLGIELLTLAQAVDLLKDQEKISRRIRKLYDEVRNVFPVIKEDRVMIEELKQVIVLLKQSKSLELSWN